MLHFSVTRSENLFILIRTHQTRAWILREHLRSWRVSTPLKSAFGNYPVTWSSATFSRPNTGRSSRFVNPILNTAMSAVQRDIRSSARMNFKFKKKLQHQRFIIIVTLFVIVSYFYLIYDRLLNVCTLKSI